MQDTEVCLQIVTNVVFYKSPGTHKSLSFKVKRSTVKVQFQPVVQLKSRNTMLKSSKVWWYSNYNFAKTMTIYLFRALVDYSQSPIFS